MNDLAKLHPLAFENLVIALARKVIGPGVMSLGAGPDGGRDGIFDGQAPYPSKSDEWKGTWIIQAKFHAGNPEQGSRWLLKEIRKELDRFNAPGTQRAWPDIWIVASNVDPSGVPFTGAYDKANALVKRIRPELAPRFHIWGGKTILDFLNQNQDIAISYRHLLTPGHVIEALLNALQQDKASARDVLRHLIVDLIEENKNTRLQDAGSKDDTKPGIHQLFMDLPYSIPESDDERLIVNDMLAAAHQPLKPSQIEGRCSSVNSRKEPREQHIWFVKAGPGRGKSTVGQYMAQLWRSAAILDNKSRLAVPVKCKELANAVKDEAEKKGHWPSVLRIPIQIELREYAQWISGQPKENPRGIVSFLSANLSRIVEVQVGVGLLRSLLRQQSWFVALDGLDEVPSDLKDEVGREAMRFMKNVCHDADCDALFLVTSRPQGYSGQFDGIDGITVTMRDLKFEEALKCATPVLSYDRTKLQAQAALDALATSRNTPAVVNLMRTPLQSHIMAIVVRDGHQPPERRWKLFANFYEVIKKREAAKKISDSILFRFLSNDDKLLKTIHNRTGFVVHARAETGKGALTNITRATFDSLVKKAAGDLVANNAEDIAIRVSRAATERLVLVNTPDSGSTIRFDVRQLQEFFAGEFIYDAVGLEQIVRRLKLLAGDAHWREVVYFAISAFLESNRTEDAWAASKILSELDSIHPRDWNPAVVSAMARGGYIVLHLAEEGVFEQDRRMREHFTPALRGCYSLCSGSALQNLRFKKDSETLSWLITEMLGAVRKGHGMDEFGAMLILICYTPDDHKNVKEITELMELCDSSVLESLLDIRLFEVPLPLQHWLLALLARQFAKNESDAAWRWYHVLIRSNRLTRSNTGHEERIKPLKAIADIDFAYRCLLSVLEILYLGADSEDPTDNYTLLENKRIASILSEHLPSKYITLFNMVIKDSDKCPINSIMGHINLTYKFAITRETALLSDIIINRSKRAPWIYFHPIVGRHLLPYDFILRLRRDGQTALAAFGLKTHNSDLLSRYGKCFTSDRHLRGPAMSLDEWVTFCEYETEFAIYRALEELNAKKSDDNRERMDVLWRNINKDPSVLQGLGKYYAELELLFGQSVRHLILGLIPTETEWDINVLNEDFKWDPPHLQVTLPREAGLLPWLAIRAIEYYGRDDHRRKDSKDSYVAIKACIMGWSDLDKIMDDNSAPLSYRSAALVLLTFGQAPPDINDEWVRGKIRELFSEKSPSFYIGFIVTWARRLPVEKMDIVAGMLGDMFSSKRLSPQQRIALEPVVAYLRETSFAPISSAKLEAEWLGEATAG